MKVLKNAAKTRKVAADEIISAFSVIEKAKLDPSGFLETLGGTESPGRTWMLVFTAEVVTYICFCTCACACACACACVILFHPFFWLSSFFLKIN